LSCGATLQFLDLLCRRSDGSLLLVLRDDRIGQFLQVRKLDRAVEFAPRRGRLRTEAKGKRPSGAIYKARFGQNGALNSLG
jgi:hypothetical protein